MDELLKKRTVMRGKATRLANECRDYRGQEHINDDDLAYMIHMLEQLEADMLVVQKQLDAEGHVDDTSHMDKLREEVFKGKRLLTKLEKRADAVPVQSEKSHLKVSDVTLPVFSGDVMSWAEFWDLFDVVVHENPRYAVVQKFAILKSHLSGPALQCLKGIPVTEACYPSAIQTLKSRFCKTERVRDEIIRQLLNMPCMSDNLAAIRSFADHLMSHVRTLDAMGVGTETFSSLLLPVAKDKLPESWRLQWARQRSSAADLNEFLAFLDTELNVREEAASVRRSTPERGAVSTVSALSVTDMAARQPGIVGNWVCPACAKNRHGLSRCAIYNRMTPQERWVVVRRAGLCFQCLGPHHVRKCKSGPCPICRSPHHSSLHSSPTDRVTPSAVTGPGVCHVPPPPPNVTQPPPRDVPTPARTVDRWQHDLPRACNRRQYCYTVVGCMDRGGTGDDRPSAVSVGVVGEAAVGGADRGGTGDDHPSAVLDEVVGEAVVGRADRVCTDAHHSAVPVVDRSEVMVDSRVGVTSHVLTAGRAYRGMESSDGSRVFDRGVQSEFFLPHRGVYRGDKLRVVFDGSAKDGMGVSLNEYLDSGVNLLRRLPAVLLCFRRDRIACQTDIKSAFHQVGIKEEDRRYVQFIWGGSHLRFRRVPFGLTCSPFLLLQTIDVHLQLYQSTDPRLCEKVASGTYMDDICTTFHTREEAVTGVARMTEIFADARMELHKVRTTGDGSPDSKVLGLTWSTLSDYLAVDVPEFECPNTKSSLLSAVSKAFDPLGLLTPWLVKGKSLFQRTWKMMSSGQWEEKLPDALQKEVADWWAGSVGRSVWFPRAFLVSDSDFPVTFHVFCDASAVAFCAVIYALQGGKSHIVMARSRLAPVSEQLSIPRLELMAALTGVRLMEFIRESLDLSLPTVCYWTDSMDALFWITSVKPRRVFVENRVAAILRLSRTDQWRHVRGDQNPADLGTRGMSLSALTECTEWWRGPESLMRGAEQAHDSVVSVFEPSDEAQRELKPDPVSRVLYVDRQNPDVRSDENDSSDPDQPGGLFDVTECSTLKKAVNRCAWVLRFVSNVRRRPADRQTSEQLTPEERREALRRLVGEAQRRHYQTELDALQHGRRLPVKSPLNKLHPQVSSDGVLESVPRTHESPIVILPEFAYISTLIIDEGHRRCFHQGTRTTLAVVSAEYAVRRRMVQRAVQTCYRCKRYKGLAYRSNEGSLPSFRSEYCRPFEKVGIDYFGPLYVDRTEKVWGLIITCATSRAIHLELIKSQSSADTALALRRFFALRGIPSLIVSDNAKTFRALLHQIPRVVTWRYIPEAAPWWWGGYWERLVGLTKRALRTTLHQCHLTFDELSVVIYEVAFFLNLRPLTPNDGGDVLTPAHLIFGVRSLAGVLSPAVRDCFHPGRAWRRRCRVADHLQRRWKREYLESLRCWRQPGGRPACLPRVGDIVLVGGAEPRSRWPLARVLELIRGPDGDCRAAYLEVRGVRTRRPICKLFRLEADPEQG